MINKQVLKDVFDTYNIEKVTLVDSNNHYIFLIDGMSSGLSLERWDYLEHILQDITNKQITLLPFNYAKKHIKLNEGIVIKQ